MRAEFRLIGENMKILDVISVSKTYINGDSFLKALDKVTLYAEQGEFITVTGASGSGKSTLLNIIGGLEYPTEGCVYIDGVNVAELSNDELSEFRLNHIGYVFQNYNLIPVISVFENIVLPAKLMGRKIDEIAVQNLAKELGIADKLFQLPDNLSGGQQQRVAIVRALYTRPLVLLADEPTGNLDSKMGMETIHLMRRMCRECNQTMIVVTHDERIAHLSDRTVQIEDGRVVSLDEQKI